MLQEQVQLLQIQRNTENELSTLIQAQRNQPLSKNTDDEIAAAQTAIYRYM